MHGKLRLRNVLLALLSISILSGSAALASPACDTDLVIVNATVYTVDPKNPVARSIAVKNGRVQSVSDAAALDCPGAVRLDLGGAFVYPGFTDSHIHLLEAGYRELTLDLRAATSLEDAMARVRARAQEVAPGQWVEGLGWIEKYWPEPRFPTRHDVDVVSAGHPVILRRSDGHTILVNTKALQLAGIDEDTPDPPNGIIQRQADGIPNGILIDDAMALVTSIIPAKSDAEDQEALELAIRRNVSLGWTQTQNAGGSDRELRLLEQLRAEGKLLHRLYYALDEENSISRLIETGPRVDPDAYLTVRTIKLFADGALGSRGAALKEKYADDDSKGLMFYTQEQIMPTLVGALRNGIQVETHAIGDLANSTVLNWYEEALRRVPAGERAFQEPRWRIEHVQVIDPVDQARLAPLGVIPSMQPSHAIVDMYFAPDRLGPDRIAHAYVWRGLIEKGSIIAGGSDAPVEVGDPRIEIYAAIERRDLNGYSNDDWHREQAVSRETALKMFTIWPAYAAFQESIRGSIEVGKLADFTVFDRDLMEVPPSQILDAQLLMTIVDGVVVYKKAAQ
ncbi:MAG: amidohydrolase [Acidobacteria bacterium]|nr:MAG: amidohydrolase [Acidobacteriota bacterium]